MLCSWGLGLLLLAPPAEAGTVVVDVLDVGQGDAILVRTGAKAALIDGGDAGAGVVDDLRALGVSRLDLVVATHPHADHIGGLKAVLDAFPVGLYLDNGHPHTTVTYTTLMEDVEDKGIPYRAATAGLRLRMDADTVFTVLFPPEDPLTGTRSDLNTNSVVLRLDHDGHSVLFMGDAEADTEAALLAAGLGHVDVLKVAHHGSGHSSTDAFLRAVKPTYALISVGIDNSYGHPDGEALARLAAVGAAVHRTDQEGTIRVQIDGDAVLVTHGSLRDLGAGLGPVILGTPPPDPRPRPHP